MKTHFTPISSLYVAAAVILLASCASPRAVIRMNPVSENVRWNYGQAFASDTVAGVVVEAAYDQSTLEYNIFDVTVINGSNMSYVVDPVNFCFHETQYDNSRDNVYRAIDPESMLLTIDKKESEVVGGAKEAPYEAVENAERQRSLWMDGTVRKTTLEPGYRIDGKIYFPRFEKAANYVLQLPIDDKFAKISFNQLTFLP
mgnify:CR=1 FL=1